MSFRIHNILMAVMAIAISGCTCLSVYTPTKGERPGSGSLKLGEVASLQGVIKKESKNINTVTVIFIHGVGDTLPGYAVGDERCKESAKINRTAWLNPTAKSVIGLDDPGPQVDTAITAGDIGIGTPADAHREVIHLRYRQFEWHYAGQHSVISLHAFEITWAPMTCWIKDTLLGYDAAKISPFSSLAGGSDREPCGVRQKKNCGAKMNAATERDPPPPRVLVNGSLKWTLVDRALSDAVIYAGTYGEAIQRGVAAALCRIANDDAPSQLAVSEANLTKKKCQWPISSSLKGQRFIFVTHSLGGRILFDTLVGLQDTTGRYEKFPNAFSTDEVKRAAPNVKAMLSRTIGIYMMANQLSFMGLTDIPIGAPMTKLKPYLLSSVDRSARGGPMRDTYPLLTLLSERAAGSVTGRKKIPLNIISFNDTNDLLTWQIPAWYEGATSTNGADVVHISDVFLKNAPHWFWLWEWPTTAHAGYLSSPRVWQVIKCGARDHHALVCD